MAKLFIVGFPRDMQEIELLEMFSIYGIVNTVTIVTDKDSGVSKGYGFITMTDEAGAGRAIAALDGAEIDERRINVRHADDKHGDNPISPKSEIKKNDHPKPAGQPNVTIPLPEKKRRPRRRI